MNIEHVTLMLDFLDKSSPRISFPEKARRDWVHSMYSVWVWSLAELEIRPYQFISVPPKRCHLLNLAEILDFQTRIQLWFSLFISQSTYAYPELQKPPHVAPLVKICFGKKPDSLHHGLYFSLGDDIENSARWQHLTIPPSSASRARMSFWHRA